MPSHRGSLVCGSRRYAVLIRFSLRLGSPPVGRTSELRVKPGRAELQAPV